MRSGSRVAVAGCCCDALAPRRRRRLQHTIASIYHGVRGSVVRLVEAALEVGSVLPTSQLEMCSPGGLVEA